jgi:ABC-type glycerol-3-phosphate transport system substrate-binding protein
LDAYKGSVTGLADWMLGVTEQPLELDNLYVASPDEKRPQADANIIQKGVDQLRAFAGSFFEDYDTLGEANVKGKAIEVWTGLGRDEAYVLKQMIDETFTPETGVNVKLNLVQNALVVATMAGNGPDVNLFTRRGEAMNLAFRGALSPLNSFAGFDSLPKEYMPTAFVPYQYQNQTYAIPDKQDFLMMFYRKDVLQDAGVKAPETWDDLLKISSILQNHNMQVGIPYENLDAGQLLNQGMGILNLFPSLLMQNGTTIYNKQLNGTSFNEPKANQAFKLWTDFYKLYDYPIYKDDLSRFRMGEMPVVITSYSFYNRLIKLAPEIAGNWAMVPIPGTKQPDGSIDHTSAANGTASVILKTAKDQASAWAFVKWWSKPEIQSQFARELENEVGILSRRLPANINALASTFWSASEQAVLYTGWKDVKEIPELPGSYYTSRNIDNAFREVVLQDENPRDSLYYWNKQINDEIKRKLYEFGEEKP